MSSLRNLQLNWLRTFEAAGRHLSFSNAATHLNMSQSAVSQQIMLLEHKLGRQLFVRRQRSIELTLAGRAYLGVVREALQHIEHGIEGIFNTEADGVLEISVNNSFVQLWLAPRFSRFSALHPQVSMRIHGVNWEAEAPPTSAELEIRYGGGIWQGYRAAELLPRTMRAYCSRSTARSIGGKGELSGVTLIDVLGTPIGWTEWLAQHAPGTRAVFKRINVDSYAVAAEMAAHDIGVCLLNEGLVTGSRLGELLVSPLEESLLDQAGFYLLRPQDRSISGAAKAFINWIQSDRALKADRAMELAALSNAPKSAVSEPKRGRANKRLV